MTELIWSESQGGGEITDWLDSNGQRYQLRKPMPAF
jgi:hypothetical protein